MLSSEDRTLEQIDNSDWGQPPYDSYLVHTCHNLRKKPLRDFTTEDLRILIGQNINLEILILFAIDRLKKDILAEGDFYEGDLLNSVLASDPEYWKSNRLHWETILQIFEQNISVLKNHDTSRTIKDGWFDNFRKFSEINVG